LSAIFSLLGVQLHAQSPGKSSYIQAENLRKEKRYSEAVAKYDEAIKLEPGNYRYYFSRGKCYYATKEYDLALASLEEAIKYKKDFVFAYTLIAKIYQRKDDLPTAIHYYDLAFQNEQDPNQKVSYKMEAIKLLLQENKTDEAQRHLQEVKALAPENLNILYFDAKISNQSGDYENAKRNMVTATTSPAMATETPANAAKYWYELGYAYNKLGDYQNSQKAWEKAYFGNFKPLIDREKSINSPDYFYRMAVSYYMASSYPETKEQIKKALELQNNFSAAYLLMGKIDKKLGDNDSAINNYRRAANFEPDATKKGKLESMLVSLQVDAEDYDGAISTANSVLAREPNNPPIIYLKALSQYYKGQYNGAIESLESLTAGTTDNLEKAKYNFLIGMAARKSDTEKAKNAFKAAMFGPYKPAAKNELDKLAKAG
jgi:tetratricopeptide (TPR) repeat protein